MIIKMYYKSMVITTRQNCCWRRSVAWWNRKNNSGLIYTFTQMWYRQSLFCAVVQNHIKDCMLKPCQAILLTNGENYDCSLWNMFAETSKTLLLLVIKIEENKISTWIFSILQFKTETLKITRSNSL